jgi:nitrite reductase/ring-hydroxylating ferredoxin subunit
VSLAPAAASGLYPVSFTLFEAGAWTLAVTSSGGVPIALVRDPDGVVRAFVNVCRHRAAPLVREDGPGERCFVCGFHGWVYDTNDGDALSTTPLCSPMLRGEMHSSSDVCILLSVAPDSTDEMGYVYAAEGYHFYAMRKYYLAKVSAIWMVSPQSQDRLFGKRRDLRFLDLLLNRFRLLFDNRQLSFLDRLLDTPTKHETAVEK